MAHTSRGRFAVTENKDLNPANQGGREIGEGVRKGLDSLPVAPAVPVAQTGAEPQGAVRDGATGPVASGSPAASAPADFDG